MGLPPVTAGEGEAAVRELHADAVVFDGHNDVALRVLDGEDPAARLEGGHLDLPRAREGGFDGGIFAVWTDPDADDPLGETLSRVGRFRRWLEATPGIRAVDDVGDLDASVSAGDVAAVVGVEGGYAVEDDLEAVERLYEAGVRCLTLTWMRPSAWADAAGAEAVHGGLSGFGGRVVDRLQRLGVVVDVSHASDAVVSDVLGRAERPVVASHSGLRSVARHPRNLPEGLLEGLAAGGGLLGVNLFPGYLEEEHGVRFDALRQRLGTELFSDEGRAAYRAATGDLEPVTVEHVADHVLRAIEVAGPGAVGLGSDFDGVPDLPAGMRDVRDLPTITAALLDRGLGRGAVRSVLGGNFLRVLREALP